MSSYKLGEKTSNNILEGPGRVSMRAPFWEKERNYEKRPGCRHLRRTRGWQRSISPYVWNARTKARKAPEKRSKLLMLKGKEERLIKKKKALPGIPPNLILGAGLTETVRSPYQ